MTDITPGKRGIPGWWPRWRRFKNRAATVAITGGGSVVLITILLLFVFLIYEVAPLAQPATMAAAASQDWKSSNSRWLSVDEYAAVAFSLAADGSAGFTRLSNGEVLNRVDLAESPVQLTAVAADGAGSGTLALGFSDGQVRVVDARYRYDLNSQTRRITPQLDYPLSAKPLMPGGSVGAGGVVALAIHLASERVARQYQDGTLEVVLFDDAQSPQVRGLGIQATASALYLLDRGRWLAHIGSDGAYSLWDLNAQPMAQPIRGRLFANGETLTASTVLQGGQSLIAASSQGALNRYYVLGSGKLVPAYRFNSDGVVMHRLIPEHRRRGFLAISTTELHWYNATAGQRHLRAPFALSPDSLLALSPRADRLLHLSYAQGRDAATHPVLETYILKNSHPEVSLASLWRKVWYEGYDSPGLVYQSSASSNNYESKFSLTPLAFGTLKAAFYAMLFATPLALCGAIYTAFFMAPMLRRRIKPLVELMEALPTVILGFLAGLWLAPLVEDQLTALLSLLLVVPLGVVVFALVWSLLPAWLRRLVPDGWHAVVLLPVMVALIVLGMSLGDPLEMWLFGGDAQGWFRRELGLAYDQRNAIIVGIAMGFAVIPTIFSMAEDAIYSVPRHLAYGSLALGATPWQTLMGVVLPTASPGVFSALMIGFGRAMGETMIVLMATGNTPIMDFNPFEGMRTLAANIAVEVPEAEVQSTHYRILFLAAFALFLFTFAVNTLAEVVRQRLRSRYGAL